MAARALRARVDRLIASRRPRIIDCTGAKEELLARLARLRENDTQDDLAEQDPAALAAIEDRLSALLDQSVARSVNFTDLSIEREHNVRFV